MFGGQPTQQVAKGGKSAPARATISTVPCFVAVGARSVLGVAKLGWVLLVAAGGGGCLTDALPRPCVPAAAAGQSEEEEEEEEEPLFQQQPTGAGQDDDADEDESEGEEDEIDVDAANKKAPGGSKPAKVIKKFHWSKQTLWCAPDCRLTELVRCRADTPLCPPLTRLCAPQIHKGATSAKDDALEQYEVDPVGFMHGRGENSGKSKWKLIGDQLVKEGLLPCAVSEKAIMDRAEVLKKESAAWLVRAQRATFLSCVCAVTLTERYCRRNTRRTAAATGCQPAVPCACARWRAARPWNGRTTCVCGAGERSRWRVRAPAPASRTPRQPRRPPRRRSRTSTRR